MAAFDPVIAWLHRAADVADAINMAATGMILTEQVVQVVRILVIAAVGWGSLALIDARSELQVLRVQHIDFERRLIDHDTKLQSGTDDRWRRRDHDAYASQIDKRLEVMQERIDAQGRNISEILRRTSSKP